MLNRLNRYVIRSSNTAYRLASNIIHTPATAYRLTSHTLGTAFELVSDIRGALQEHPRFVLNATIAGAVYAVYKGLYILLDLQASAPHPNSAENRDLFMQTINTILTKYNCTVTDLPYKLKDIKFVCHDGLFNQEKAVREIHDAAAVQQDNFDMAVTQTALAGAFGPAVCTLLGGGIGFFSSVATVNAKRKVKSALEARAAQVDHDDDVESAGPALDIPNLHIS